MSLVLPGASETFAKLRRAVSELISDDLPTFDRPMSANSGRGQEGAERKSGAPIENSADEIFMAMSGALPRRGGRPAMRQTPPSVGRLPGTTDWHPPSLEPRG